MPRVPLYSRLVEALQEKIVRGEVLSGEPLPSEAEMADGFGCSRATLREALHVLETKGWIVRRHGIGSFVARRELILTGLERLESFSETIRRSGHDARDIVLELAEVVPSPEVRRALELADDEVARGIRSLRTADGCPVIYCDDVISPAIVDSLPSLERRRERESLIEFFSKDCGLRIGSALLSVLAAPAEGQVANILQVPPGAPLLVLKGPAYDQVGRPLYFSTNYVRTDRYQFTVVRR